MITFGQAYFYVCGFLAVLGALTVVLSKNPIRGAMGLLFMILCVAGLFLALHAQFLAAIQLIVYAGAIVVLFLFVIMLLGPSASTPSDHRGRIPRAVAGALFGAAGLAAVALVGASITKPVVAVAAGAAAGAASAAPPVALLAATPNDFGTIDAFGRVLFTQGLVPFELSSALLMVAIVGAVAVARGRSKDERIEAEAVAARRGAES